ncbi:MAG: cupin domain-containing protein [Cyanobacteria bacterium P01_A01_bin.84]
MNEKKSDNPAFSIAHFNFDNLPYLSSPRRQLDLKAVAIGLIQLPADEGYTFTHSHAEQEEVYIIISGQGVILIDGKIIEISRGDIVRVSPQAKRALKAAKHTPLFAICAGGVASGYPKNPNARYLIDDGVPDYDDIPPWYQGRHEILQRNANLKERMLKAKAIKQVQQDNRFP